MAGRRPQKKTRNRRSRRRGTRQQQATGSVAFRWVVSFLILILVCLLGLLAWSRTPMGRAALLRLGADKFYGVVQTGIGEALGTVLIGFPQGPAGIQDAGVGNTPLDFDWAVGWVAPGAAIHCRQVPVPAEQSFWEVQHALAAAIQPVGGRILWGERLTRSGKIGIQTEPDDASDLLRLDLGVTGRPTHTLVLYRAEAGPPFLSWGRSAAATAWTHLVCEPAQPTIALVIDDWGYFQNEVTQQILSLPCPLTLCVLPNVAFSRRFALEATDLALPPDLTDQESISTVAAGDQLWLRRLAAGCCVELRLGRSVPGLPVRRREVLLHMPMEPQGYPTVNPGEEAILVGMSAREIAGKIDQALISLPGVTGLNNHMGSRATADRKTMDAMMSHLARRGLFFLDSMTTSNSVGSTAAARAGVPFQQNRIFLDQREVDLAMVHQLLQQLVRAARATGFAIGIGHPNEWLARVLAEEVPRLQREGIRLVTVSEMRALQQAGAVTGE